ncbi:MAG: tetratricopeptide repeat protein [Limisphaerales bacterium]
MNVQPTSTFRLLPLCLSLLILVACGDSSEFKSALKRARADDAQAQLELAQMYMHGKGTKQSETEARKWCEKAAAKGLPVAQRIYGTMLRDAYGAEVRDIPKAREWLTKAAEQGDAQAKAELAVTPSLPAAK